MSAKSSAPETAMKVAPEVEQYDSNPFALVGASINVYKYNVRGLILALLAIFGIIIGVVIAGVITAAQVYNQGGIDQVASLGWSLLAGLTTMLVTFLLLATALNSYLIVIMTASAEGVRLSIGQGLKKTLRRLPAMIGASIIIGFLTILGLLFFIIPGLIFAAWYSLAGVAIVKEGLGPIAAIKRSKQLIQGHVIETWGVMSLQSTILGIAMLASMPVRFIQLDALKKQKQPKPDIHWANYLAILIGIIYNFSFNGGGYVPNEPTDSNNGYTPPSIEQPAEPEPSGI